MTIVRENSQLFKGYSGTMEWEWIYMVPFKVNTPEEKKCVKTIFVHGTKGSQRLTPGPLVFGCECKQGEALSSLSLLGVLGHCLGRHLHAG